MGRPKKYIENEVNEEKVSETPAVLVAPAKEENQLSPNPANSGFVKQLFVDSLPDSGEPYVLYIVPKKSNGAVVGYKNWRWNPTDKKFERVYGSDPALKLGKGEQGVVDNVVNEPKKAPEKVFEGEVVFKEEPTIEGKKLHDWVDAEGGVTEEELKDALAKKQDLLDEANVPEGSVQKLIGFNGDGEVVSDDIPAGIVVDDSLDVSSDNAISNKAVSTRVATLESDLADEYDDTQTYEVGDYVIHNGALYRCKTEITVAESWTAAHWEVTSVEDELALLRAQLLDGRLIPEKSQTAKNLLPVSSTSGSTQTAPFINQGTATNNNDSQAEVDTGTLGQHLEKQGNMVCVNQLAEVLNSTNYETYKGSATYSDGVATFTANGEDGYLLSAVGHRAARISGHKYLGIGTIKLTTYNENIKFRMYVGNSYTANHSLKNTNNWQTIFVIDTATSSASDTNIGIFDRRASDWDTVQIKDVILIDLTQLFNGDIPQDLLDNPENFFRYYNGSLDYNEGTLVNSNGRYLVNGQSQNVWDEVAEQGSISNSGNNTSGDYLRSKNYIHVIPNREYYFKRPANIKMWIYCYDKDKNFVDVDDGASHNPYFTLGNVVMTYTIPSNVIYIRFVIDSNYGLVYNHDITISLYYEGEDYSQYVAWKEPKVYDTGSEELRSVGSVKDTKTPDGTITRRISEELDLSQLVWDTTTYLTYGVIRAALPSRALPNSVFYTNSAYKKVDSITVGIQEMVEGDLRQTEGYIYLKITGTPSGKCIYILETPITEQGTPFSENMDINDMSNMAWYSAYTDENNNTLVSVPQGCKIFYPAWYAGFVDSLGQREDIDWASEQIVSQSQLGAVNEKIGAKLPECPTDTDGTYILKATVSGGEVTYAWVADE